ncbi:MAG: hypothetical protein IKP88_04530 [Lachnospiraceae bacterium]|nr:hypothetical protein [Lachnospiraceae bacterium]
MGNKKNQPNKSEKIVAPVEIDYKKLADAIVEAQDRAIEKRNTREEERKVNENKEWRALFGYEENKPLTNIKAFIKLLFVKRKDVKGDRATFALLQMSAELILKIAKWALYLFSAGCVLYLINIIYTKQNINVWIIVLNIIIGVLAFVYAQMLRIAEIEIGNLTDREYLNTIVASITALVAMVLSVISLFKET